MSDDDRARWDDRHSEGDPPSAGEVRPPAAFALVAHLFPSVGTALDVACGRGGATVWLAERGMEVLGLDVSPIAVDRARELARIEGVADRCRIEVHDLDGGLPPGPPVDLVLCHLFRDSRLDRAMIDRVAPGGVLAVATLSEVGVGPGRFRARPGELREAFGGLEILAEDEGDGIAWLMGRKAGR